MGAGGKAEARRGVTEGARIGDAIGGVFAAGAGGTTGGTIGVSAGVAMTRGDGVAVGDATAAPAGVGVGVGVVAARGDGVAVADATGKTVGVGVAVETKRGDGLAVGEEVAIGVPVVGSVAACVEIALTVGTGVSELAATSGFSNFFGGASGGGVASARILARTRSASGGFTVARSTVTCVIGAPTVRGRSTARALKSGVIIAIVSPRTTAWGA